MDWEPLREWGKVLCSLSLKNVREMENIKILSILYRDVYKRQGPDTLNKRANMPSKKSNTAPSIMKEMAKV